MDQVADASGVTVARWKRYGHDRLYVKDADGQALGWWDLATDEPHPENDELLEVVTEAVARWRAASSPVEAPPEVPLSAPATLPDRPWLDLSTNAPGAGVRDLADSAFLAAPVRTTFARVLGVKNDERAWRIGADGEEKVAARLAKVAKRDPRWRFLHSIPVGSRGADIDHLVIGPGGVFTINTKHHPKAKIWVGGNTFLVDGHQQPYVRNARFEASRAAELLSAATGLGVPVDGLIITVNAADVIVKSQPTGVHVLPRMQVASWLLRLGETLEKPQLDAIWDAARRSTTWRS